MHPAVLALSDLLANATAGTVEVVSIPTDRISGDAVQIWPWRVDEDQLIRHTDVGTPVAPRIPDIKVSCMVFARDLETLELARIGVLHNPVVSSVDQRIVIRSDPLDSALLLNLFLAARVLPRPCLSCVLQASAA